MSAPHDLDRRLDDWLQDGPSRAPERSIAAALDHAATHPRRRDPLAVLRRDPMGSGGFGHGRAALVPLVAALGLLLVAALAVATVGGLFTAQPVVVPPLPSTSPAPSAAPSARPPDQRAEAGPERLAGHAGSTSSTTSVADAYVEIMDQSGTLVGARTGTVVRGGSGRAGDIGANNLAGDPASIVLSWAGCPSDTRHVLTIAADRRTMTLDQPVCQGDTLGVDRVLVLTFDRAVPAAEVDVTHRIPAADAARGPAAARRQPQGGIGARNSTIVVRQPVRELHPDHVGDIRPDDRPRVGCLGLEHGVPSSATSEKSRLPATSRTGQRSSARRSRAAGRAGSPARDVPGSVERQVHLVDQVPDRSGHPAGRLARTVDPDPSLERGQGRGVERPAASIRSYSASIAGLGRGLDPPSKPARPAADADDRDDPLGRLDRGIEGEHPAARVADERPPARSRAHPSRPEVVARRELDVLGRRRAEAACVEADDAVAGGGERRDHARPTLDDRRSRRGAGRAADRPPRRATKRRPPGTSTWLAVMRVARPVRVRRSGGIADAGACRPLRRRAVSPRGRSAPGRSCGPGACGRPRSGPAPPG